MTICLIDTTVFCNLLGIPFMGDQRERALREQGEYIRARTRLLLPVTTIIETGSHVALYKDGQTKRRIAQTFTDQVRLALLGEAPWIATPLFDLDLLRAYLATFPSQQCVGSG